MSRNRIVRWGAALASVLALSTVAADAAQRDGRGNDRGKRGPDQLLVATTDSNQLITFNAKDRRIRKLVSIKGLPAGESLVGIDFQPASGALYGVGTNEIVYRINERTGIVFPESPTAFTPALNGQSFGIDFNPVVNRLRIVSDADQNLAADADANTVAVNGTLNPAGEQIVGAGYENSQFSPTAPAATTLHVVGAANDRLYTQNPPAAGTLTNPRNLRVPGSGRLDVGLNVGFDIEGDSGLGYLTNADPRRGTTLYTVDVPTGKAKSLGRIGGRSLTLTGLAVVQGLGS
jgi:hypothetical protein